VSETRKYRQFSPDQKAEIVLAGLRGDRAVRDVGGNSLSAGYDSATPASCSTSAEFCQAWVRSTCQRPEASMTSARCPSSSPCTSTRRPAPGPAGCRTRRPDAAARRS